MAAKAALREQTSEHAGEDAIDMQDHTAIADPLSEQQKLSKELQEMLDEKNAMLEQQVIANNKELEEKDKQLREKDKLIQVLLDQIHMLGQLGGNAQQNSPAAPKVGSSLGAIKPGASSASANTRSGLESANGGPSYSNDEPGDGIKRED
jgi:hypothetical protein